MCVTEKKPAHRVVAGDYVQLAGRDFDRVIGVAVQPDGRRRLRFGAYEVTLPPDRVVQSY